MKRFKKIVNPTYFRTLFKTKEEFINFLNIDLNGTHLEDLEETLQLFKEAEFFEDCIIIESAINEIKLKKVLSNLGIELLNNCTIKVKNQEDANKNY